MQLFQLCLAFWDPMNCNQPGSSAHGIIQAGILERVLILSSRGSFDPKIEPAFPVSPALQANCIRASREAPSLWQGCANLFCSQVQLSSVTQLCLTLCILDTTLTLTLTLALALTLTLTLTLTLALALALAQA